MRTYIHYHPLNALHCAPVQLYTLASEDTEVSAASFIMLFHMGSPFLAIVHCDLSDSFRSDKLLIAFSLRYCEKSLSSRYYDFSVHTFKFIQFSVRYPSDSMIQIHKTETFP